MELLAEAHPQGTLSIFEVTRRVITVFDLDDDTAQWLLDETVVREPAPARMRGCVVRSGP